MKIISGVEKNYAWGSKSLVPCFLGRKNENERPIAEVWFGAHPSSSALVEGDSLISHISEDPIKQLGPTVSSRFGDTLPFQVKLLSAEKPLSIQVHPDRDQARKKYFQEEEKNIPIDAPHRNYKDANHKPEILVALTPFSALVGLRPKGEILSILEAFELTLLREAFLTGETQGLFQAILSLNEKDLAISLNHLHDIIDAPIRGFEPLVEQTQRIASFYPRDPGTLCSLFMNRIDLDPGEAIFVKAGQLHAYLWGLGVEIMANSDNVLRCGLTVKHIDTKEVIRTVDWASSQVSKITLEGNSYPLSVEEFKVSVEEFSGSIILGADGPKIVLCIDGEFADISRGEAIWIPAEKRKFQLKGSGIALIVTVGGSAVERQF